MYSLFSCLLSACYYYYITYCMLTSNAFQPIAGLVYYVAMPTVSLIPNAQAAAAATAAAAGALITNATSVAYFDEKNQVT